MNNIERALDAAKFGYVSGDHHKMWIIDQMVRALTDCPVTEKVGRDVNNQRYFYEVQGESDAYRAWVEARPFWSTGGAP